LQKLPYRCRANSVRTVRTESVIVTGLVIVKGKGDGERGFAGLVIVKGKGDRERGRDRDRPIPIPIPVTGEAGLFTAPARHCVGAFSRVGPRCKEKSNAARPASRRRPPASGVSSCVAVSAGGD
jgi:hypothetical protein